MSRGDGRNKILDAALAVIREKGYSATSVDELCQRAGVTKGAFFHHFRSKEDLAVAAATHFGDMADGLFSGAPFNALPTARERILGYVRYRRDILDGEIPDYTCLLGTMVQETYGSHPEIRAACEKEIVRHTSTLEPDLAVALTEAGHPAWSPAGLSLHIQGTLQGAFILAKATGSAEIARESLGHLLRYLEAVLSTKTERGFQS